MYWPRKRGTDPGRPLQDSVSSIRPASPVCRDRAISSRGSDSSRWGLGEVNGRGEWAGSRPKNSRNNCRSWATRRGGPACPFSFTATNTEKFLVAVAADKLFHTAAASFQGSAEVCAKPRCSAFIASLSAPVPNRSRLVVRFTARGHQLTRRPSSTHRSPPAPSSGSARCGCEHAARGDRQCTSGRPAAGRPGMSTLLLPSGAIRSRIARPNRAIPQSLQRRCARRVQERLRLYGATLYTRFVIGEDTL